MPKRIRLSRKKGWRKPDNTIVVSRPSKWGNPFKVVKWPGNRWRILNTFNGYHCGRAYNEKRKAVERSVQMYENSFLFSDEKRKLLREELAGKDLACWCKLDEPCHADVLLRLANNPLVRNA